MSAFSGSVTGSKACAAPRADDQRGAWSFPVSAPWAGERTLTSMII